MRSDGGSDFRFRRVQINPCQANPSPEASGRILLRNSCRSTTCTHTQRPSMYSGRRRCGGGSGTKGGGSKTSRDMAGASSSPPSTMLPASKSSLHHNKDSRVNGGGAAFSVRLQAKDILAELERSAGKSGGLGTSARGREADHQVREKARRRTAEGVFLSKSDSGTFSRVKRQAMSLRLVGRQPVR